ncbi:metalloregulator ArsR/SmtB family transcription factor [Fictibacillus enclensis]|uniref:ArsR/SmtB family transcription factor n=1 Tax=Fictibacillus enclensis TaxID=1017270 RepID=UPI0025A163DF|nr:metalloregulator ArsR/SmtB family transcription factor [Fictibacillus enclensis]MDM5199317.1 metalloregulator ArsR/SmtB family transcription factor [Fictibacillus enclensis]
MQKEIPLQDLSHDNEFERYESQFKALADKKRLRIMNILTQKGRTCVCDLVDVMDMKQSKLSYHLKILWDAGIIHKETEGTNSYYSINMKEINHLLSHELCCIFKPSC